MEIIDFPSNFVDSVSYNIRFIANNVMREELRKSQFHEKMKYKINKLSLNYGFKGHMEYYIDKNKLDGKRGGFVDNVWLNKNKLIAAFEIDSYPRKKSYNKLMALKTNFRFWVYYGSSLSKMDDFLSKKDPDHEIKLIKLENLTFKR